MVSITHDILSDSNTYPSKQGKYWQNKRSPSEIVTQGEMKNLPKYSKEIGNILKNIQSQLGESSKEVSKLITSVIKERNKTFEEKPSDRKKELSDIRTSRIYDVLSYEESFVHNREVKKIFRKTNTLLIDINKNIKTSTKLLPKDDIKGFDKIKDWFVSFPSWVKNDLPSLVLRNVSGGLKSITSHLLMTLNQNIQQGFFEFVWEPMKDAISGAVGYTIKELFLKGKILTIPVRAIRSVFETLKEAGEYGASIVKDKGWSLLKTGFKLSGIIGLYKGLADFSRQLPGEGQLSIYNRALKGLGTFLNTLGFGLPNIISKYFGFHDVTDVLDKGFSYISEFFVNTSNSVREIINKEQTYFNKAMNTREYIAGLFVRTSTNIQTVRDNFIKDIPNIALNILNKVFSEDEINKRLGFVVGTIFNENRTWKDIIKSLWSVGLHGIIKSSKVIWDFTLDISKKVWDEISSSDFYIDIKNRVLGVYDTIKYHINSKIIVPLSTAWDNLNHIWDGFDISEFSRDLGWRAVKFLTSLAKDLTLRILDEIYISAKAATQSVIGKYLDFTDKIEKNIEFVIGSVVSFLQDSVLSVSNIIETLKSYFKSSVYNITQSIPVLNKLIPEDWNIPESEIAKPTIVREKIKPSSDYNLKAVLSTSDEKQLFDLANQIRLLNSSLSEVVNTSMSLESAKPDTSVILRRRDNKSISFSENKRLLKERIDIENKLNTLYHKEEEIRSNLSSINTDMEKILSKYKIPSLGDKELANRIEYIMNSAVMSNNEVIVNAMKTSMDNTKVLYNNTVKKVKDTTSDTVSSLYNSLLNIFKPQDNLKEEFSKNYQIANEISRNEKSSVYSTLNKTSESLDLPVMTKPSFYPKYIENKKSSTVSDYVKNNLKEGINTFDNFEIDSEVGSEGSLSFSSMGDIFDTSMDKFKDLKPMDKVIAAMETILPDSIINPSGVGQVERIADYDESNPLKKLIDSVLSNSNKENKEKSPSQSVNKNPLPSSTQYTPSHAASSEIPITLTSNGLLLLTNMG